MILFIVLGIIVLMTFGVLGALFFMLAKEGQSKEEEKVVPLTDLAQIKKELSDQLFEPNENKVVEKDNEIIPVYETKIQEPVPEQPPQPSPEDIAYKKRAQQLEDELLAISKMANGQSDEARQLIVNLTKENESLKGEKAALEEAQQKLTALEQAAENLKTENVSLQFQLESTSAKVQLLEDQMTAVKLQMGEEISRANATVAEITREKESLLNVPKPEPDEALRQELQALKIEHAQLQQKFDDVEKNNQELKDLSSHFGEEISRANAFAAQLIQEKEVQAALPKPEPDEALRQELEALKIEHEQLKTLSSHFGEEISRANAIVAGMIQEKEALAALPKPESDEAMRLELETLKSEQAPLKQKLDDLEKNNQELKALSEKLTEKSEALEYESIKAKAQSSGLERISFNYKNQLEDFFKKVNALQVTNDHLSQVKNQLEGMVEEVKLQNEELSQKDRLAQFQLEQNRSRLQELERECQEIKSRLQQMGQQ